VAAEHATKIYAVAITGIVVIVAFLALTSTGHVIDAATQHFMLFYAGVFALIGLCASTGLGLIATDRVFLHPGHRVFAQSAHRAASFGAVAFLIIHIVTEILAQRVHVLDAVVPFLSPFRTFYIGLGTIASDLILLVVITGIMRGRFNARGKPWRWRAIHYSSYASFVFGIWHGLLAGRPGKPYVDWSYGLLVALVLLALAVRILANSLRPKENLSAPPVEMSAHSASAPMRAAAMFAQLGAARGANTGGQDRLMVSSVQEPALSAPVSGGYATGPMLTAPLPAGTGQTYYEPGYEGPARYLGAPRNPGSGPMPRVGSGPMPRAASGPMPRAATGPIPRTGTGPIPAGTGPMPRAWTGPMPVPGSDQRPSAGSGPWPQSGDWSGPMPRAASGPMPRAGSGPMPRAATGPQPRTSTGPFPRSGTGPIPHAGTGPMPRAATGPQPWPTSSGPASGPAPRAATGPQPWPRSSGPASGPIPRAATGPQPWPGSGLGSGPMPRPGTGPMPAAPGRNQGSFSGQQPRAGTGPMPRPQTGPMPRAGSGPMPRPQTGPMPLGGAGPRSGAGPRAGRGPQSGYPPQGGYPGQPGPGGDGRPRPGGDGGGNRGQAPWEGGLPEPDPTFRYREPGPGMPGYRGSRDHRYGGDTR
jgi:hypothetical protein